MGEIPGVTLLCGDALAMLATLPDASVQAVITSPPYWHLRDYGTGVWDDGDPGCDHRMSNKVSGSTTLRADGRAHEGLYVGEKKRVLATPYGSQCGKCGAVRVDRQLGLEETPGRYVARLVAVFEQVWRVLRADGTVWLNLGDSYINDAKWGGQSGSKNRNSARGGYSGQRARRATGLKQKDLAGIPWRVAFALQDAGWYLRADLIWHKLNPLPESVQDRPTRAHEYLFLLARQPHYYYDPVAIREPQTGTAHPRGGGVTPKSAAPGAGIRANDSFQAAVAGVVDLEGGRNRRSVWATISEPYPGSHFAVFPEALVEPCILAGTPTQSCGACGKPWRRMLEKTAWNGRAPRRGEARGWVPLPGRATAGGQQRIHGTNGQTSSYQVHTHGWQPGCRCDTEPAPAVVLDPFAGSGTSGAVAVRLGRAFIGIDLSAAYVAMAGRRIQHAYYESRYGTAHKAETPLEGQLSLLDREERS